MDTDKKIGIIVSRFNEIITGNLLKGCLASLHEKGLSEDNVDIFYVPGAYEIPVVLKKLCKSGKYKGVVTLGCLIKGETAHFEYICGPVSLSINEISCEFGIPVGFGVLTCYTAQQAYERSLLEPLNAESNKGYECGVVVLEMIELLKKI